MLYLKTFSHLWQYLSELFLEWEIFQIKFEEKLKTPILCWVTFSENRAVYEIRSIIVVEPERPQTMWGTGVSYWISKAWSQTPAPVHPHPHVHKHCMLDKQGYMQPRAFTRPRTRAYARIRSRACKHKYVIFIAFRHQQCLANALKCYVIRTLSVLFTLWYKCMSHMFQWLLIGCEW